ncbi:MAG: ParA family protein [Desulfuromonadales bacterium]
MSLPYIVTISSEKGGVGKTTLATNLAIYLKALHEDLPVILLSFDNHFSVDQMFRIRSPQSSGDVSNLFTGGNLDTLVETGEYGVQFIPSSHQMHLLRREIDDPSLLARTLVKTDLSGIMIIDTRPDLDIFTQNALFVADRVIVPVKDAPSMDNCRHIYDFFDAHGLSRRPLRVLPCLIDGRIRYQGPFQDSYQLLKAYALNRGYRCLEGYIAKSPKVESLNTNPEGKIYPVLSHGRQTDVHVQMAHVARQVYLDAIEIKTRRLQEFAGQLSNAEQEHQSAYEERFKNLAGACLVCGKPLIQDLFRESAQRSFFLVQRAPHTKNFYQQKLSFYRFDEKGLEVSHKTIELQEYEKRLLTRERSDLFRLLERSLLDDTGRLKDAFLLIRKVSSDLPEEILYDQNYADFAAVMARVSTQLP